MGVHRSITRAERFSALVSRTMRSCGYSGVRFSKNSLSRACSGASKLTASTLISAKYRSPSLGGRICPDTVSPVCRSNLRICDVEVFCDLRELLNALVFQIGDVEAASASLTLRLRRGFSGLRRLDLRLLH